MFIRTNSIVIAVNMKKELIVVFITQFKLNQLLFLVQMTKFRAEVKSIDYIEPINRI